MGFANQLLREEHVRRAVCRAPTTHPPPQDLAPPRPLHTVYHAGRAQFLPPSYAMTARPRRCRANSGAPSYSTRLPPDALARPSIPAPVAGGLTPQHVPVPANYVAARDDGSLPVRMAGADANGAASVRWAVPIESVDVGAVLPLLVDGLRDDTDVGRFVAAQGACELADAAACRGALLPHVPALVEPLRSALSTRQPHILCAALRLLARLVRIDAVGLAFRPYFGKLLAQVAPLLLRRATFPSGDGFDHATDRAISPDDLAAALLPLLEAHGGPGAGAEIRRTIPSYRPQAEPLHRGFMAPTFRNGDRVLVSRGLVELVGRGASGGAAIAVTAPLKRGLGVGTTTLRGLENRPGEVIDLRKHGKQRIDACFVNTPRGG